MSNRTSMESKLGKFIDENGDIIYKSQCLIEPVWNQNLFESGWRYGSRLFRLNV